MKKYYYVRIANTKAKEIEEALKPVITTITICKSKKVVSALKGIKKAKIEKGKEGLIPFPIICELKTTIDNRKQLVDVITGKTYWAKDKSNSINPSIRSILEPIDEINADELKKIIKILDTEELDNYQKRINKLNELMEKGYRDYLEHIDSENIKKYTNKR